MDENLLNQEIDIIDIPAEEIEQDIETEEVVQNSTLEEVEQDIVVEAEEEFEIDISEGVGWVSGDARYHNSLLGTDGANQHPIEAITGLKTRLESIERLKTVHSNQFNVASYYKWDDVAYDTHGYFVSIVPETSTIKLCSGSDIFGVSVDSAGFVGGQDAVVPRDNTYGLIVTSGLVDVRCELDVAIGDVVTSNASGYATKTNSGYGYKVLGKETKDGVEYAIIVLGVQADKINLLGAELNEVKEQVDANYTNIISAVNLANQAYNKASQIEVSNKIISGRVDGALTDVENMGAIVENMGTQVSQTQILSAQAKAIAESAATSAESMKNEAIDEANNAAKQVGELTKTLEPLTTWEDPATGNKGASYLADYIDNGLVTKAEIETVEEDLEHSKSAILKNAKSLQSIVISIDKYSVGELSTADGLTLDQAAGILEQDIIYVPTVDHDEKYSEYERSFLRGYLYRWGKVSEDQFGWITIDQNYSKDKLNTSAPAVVFAPTKQEGGGNFGYWYTDGKDVAEGYEPYTLYKWENDQWIAVATLAGNVNNRTISQIRQDANSISLEVTNARGSAATLGARLSDTESDVQSLVTWTTDEDGNQYNLATIKQTANAAGASITQVVEAVGENGEVNAASITTAINKDGSSAVINANHIKFEGFVSFASKDDVKEVQDNAVCDTKVEYALSTSSTEFTALEGVAGQWSTVAPAWREGAYMWQRTTITKGDGSTGGSSAPTCIQGARGDDGKTPYVKDGNWWIDNTDLGVQAKGETPTIEINNGYWVINGTNTTIKAEGSDAPKVVSEQKQFHTFSSNTTAPDKNSNGWASIPMNYDKTKFLWTRSIYTMDKGDPIKGDAYLDKNFTTISKWCKDNNEAYIDGANIYAGSITAEQIETKTITAEKIAADAITAEKIAADAITSRNYYKKNADGTYVTDVSGNRVRSDGETGMKIDLANGTWDSKDFKINSTGEITATGGKIGSWNIDGDEIYKEASNGAHIAGMSAGNTQYSSIVASDKTSPIRFYSGGFDDVPASTNTIKLTFTTTNVGEKISQSFPIASGYDIKETVFSTTKIRHVPTKTIHEISLTLYDNGLMYAIDTDIENAYPSWIPKEYVRVLSYNTNFRAHVKDNGVVRITGTYSSSTANIDVYIYYDWTETLKISALHNKPMSSLDVVFESQTKGITYNIDLIYTLDIQHQNFRVLEDGSMYANAVKIKGDITADRGLFNGLIIADVGGRLGSFDIHQDSIASTSGALVMKTNGSLVADTLNVKNDCIATNVCASKIVGKYTDSPYLLFDAVAASQEEYRVDVDSITWNIEEEATYNWLNVIKTEGRVVVDVNFNKDFVLTQEVFICAIYNTSDGYTFNRTSIYIVEASTSFATVEFPHATSGVAGGANRDGVFSSAYVQSTPIIQMKPSATSAIMSSASFIPTTTRLCLGQLSDTTWDYAYLKHDTHTSDKKEKNNITDIDVEFSKRLVDGLTPKSYQFKTSNTPRTHYGFIAQDVEELLHSLGTSADEVGIVCKSKPGEPDGDDNHYSLNYINLIAPMVSVIQQLLKRVDELETKLNTQQNE